MSKLNTQSLVLTVSVLVTANTFSLPANSWAQSASQQVLATAPVRSANDQIQLRVDGVVEAVRYTDISAQVS